MRLAVSLPTLLLGSSLAADTAWVAISPTQWQGATALQVPALKRTAATAIAMPVDEAQVLRVATREDLPAGLYEVRLTLRPSHTAGAVAFHAGLHAKAGDSLVATFPGQFFARPHEAEMRSFQMVKTEPGPLQLTLEAYADAEIAQGVWAKDQV
ncbi:MAG: hypothetical protein ACYTGH_04840, partial [Planctomycetota bacterium]